MLQADSTGRAQLTGVALDTQLDFKMKEKSKFLTNTPAAPRFPDV